MREQKIITAYISFRSTRHFERNFSFSLTIFSFSIHILFDNWVRNSLLLGSFRTSEGTKPRCSSTLSSSFAETEACWLFPDLSWLIVEAEKCCLNPRKELVCFPTFCLKTLKDSVWFPVLLVTTAIVTVFVFSVLQYQWQLGWCLAHQLCFLYLLLYFHSQGHNILHFSFIKLLPSAVSGPESYQKILLINSLLLVGFH